MFDLCQVLGGIAQVFGQETFSILQPILQHHIGLPERRQLLFLFIWFFLQCSASWWTYPRGGQGRTLIFPTPALPLCISFNTHSLYANSQYHHPNPAVIFSPMFTATLGKLTPSQRHTRSVGGMLACMYTWSESRKRVSITSDVSFRVFISFTICKELLMSGIWDFNLLKCHLILVQMELMF